MSPTPLPSQALDLARAHARRGDWELAAASFRRVLERQPQSDMALAGLGHCLGRLGRRREALDCLAQAGKLLARGLRKSGRADPLLDVAHEMHQQRGFAESLPLLEQALKIEPASARGHHLKAQALDRLNQVAAARQSAARAVALAPGEANATIQLASLEARDEDLDSARRRLEGLLATPTPAQRSRALFELGRVLDRQGEHEAAFSRIREAGQLALAEPTAARYDRQGIYRELAIEREQCDPPYFQKLAETVPADGLPDPVFLVGYYRSGTTLLEQILATHPRVRSSDEADLVPRALRELHRLAPAPGLHWRQRLEAAGPAARARLRAYYWQQVAANLGPLTADTLLLDKTALNTVNLGFINALFPTARVLFALRDPRDAVLSAFMQALVPNALTVHLLDWEAGVRFYAAVMDHWLVMRERITLPWLALRYEDLTADLPGALAPVLTHLGLDWRPEMARFHEGARRRGIATPSFAQVSQPLHQASLGRWRRHAAAFDPVMPVLAPWVARFGYAP